MLLTNPLIVSRLFFFKTYGIFSFSELTNDPNILRTNNDALVKLYFHPSHYFQCLFCNKDSQYIKNRYTDFMNFPFYILTFLTQNFFYRSHHRFSIDIKLAMLLFLSFSLRFYSLGFPRRVIFDEVHFGKAVNGYLEKRNFFDLHPPLGKLLFYSVACFFGNQIPNFRFDHIDQQIPDNFPIFYIRGLSALFGTFTPVLLYFIILTFKFSDFTALLAGILATFDNALIIQSRLIMLDSLLCFFILLSTYFMLQFISHRFQFFSLQWFILIFLTGLSIGICLGIKQSALLTVIYLYILSFLDVFDLLTIVPNTFYFCCHLFLRLFFFFVIPIFAQFIFYIIHANILILPGDDDYLFSTQYKQSNFFIVYPSNSESSSILSYGSLFELEFLLPDIKEGFCVESQEVISIPLDGINNQWIITKPFEYARYDSIKDLDIVEIRQMKTGRKLVYSYSSGKIIPAHQVFLDFHRNTSYFQSRWRLFNNQSKFTLLPIILSRNNLDEFVSFQEIPNNNVDNSIKFNFSLLSRLNGFISNLVKLKQTILNFLELYYLMVSLNSLLSEHPFSSSPLSWPFLTNTLPYWKDSKSNAQIHLVGNIFIWYLGILFLVLFVLFFFFSMINFFTKSQTFVFFGKFKYVGIIFLLGWIIHFFPFFLISRVLFLHHYLPALLFKLLLFATTVELLKYFLISFRRYQTLLRLLVNSFYFFVCFCSVFVFFQLSVISYGLETFNVSKQHFTFSTWVLFT